MPVGVPKIAFQFPDDEDSSWMDMYNIVYRTRALFLGEEIGTENGNNIMGLLACLSLQDPTQDLYLFINSPGGSVIPGMGIYDMMQDVTADVSTICMGISVSMASIILVGGEITKRIAFPHAKVMIHQPVSGMDRSKNGEFVLNSDIIRHYRRTFARIYARRTRQPLWVVEFDMERDVFMSATEARDYGIVDVIGEKEIVDVMGEEEEEIIDLIWEEENK